MANEQQIMTHPVRRAVLQALGLAEDVVYAGVGLLLAIVGLAFLGLALKAVGSALLAGLMPGQGVGILDQILVILLIVELLYTIQVSFREHGLLAEPFLVVALIAIIRRVLVLTAELPKLPEAGASVFSHAVIELGLLVVMIFVLVASLVLLQRHTRNRTPKSDE